ncbi:MAG: hypothetical protein QM503_03775 [Bacteroidota bacterium]
MSKNLKYILKFDSQQAFEDYKASHLMEGDQLDSNIKSVRELGTLCHQPPWDPQTEEEPDKVTLDGYHVNLLCEFKRTTLNEFIVDPIPVTPAHRFSGEEELHEIVTKNE